MVELRRTIMTMINSLLCHGWFMGSRIGHAGKVSTADYMQGMFQEMFQGYFKGCFKDISIVLGDHPIS